jgi:5-methyltetrahydropteroyltriglutamate--homocysteine methyltransferase
MSRTLNLGFPRIGGARELKKATESYWKGKVTLEELQETGRRLRRENWLLQKEAGVESIPCNDFSFYDQVLDTTALLGAVPSRYGWSGNEVDSGTYFAMARGLQKGGKDLKAMSMLKWFDTNYHYIVPEFTRDQTFSLSSRKPMDELEEAKALGVDARPVLVGPLSYVLLGRAKEEGVDLLGATLDALLEIYAEVVAELARAGATWIQLDEPCLVWDMEGEALEALERAYRKLAESRGKANLAVATYFGHVAPVYERLARLPVQGLFLDFVRGDKNLEAIERHGFPEDKVLGAGIVNGRNIWINDLSASLDVLERLAKHVDRERLWVGPSCSLLHVPIDVDLETGLDPEVRSWCAFAKQKLGEIAILHRGLEEGRDAVASEIESNRRVLEARARSEKTRRPEVRERMEALRPEDMRRSTPAPERRRKQRESLGLPAFPTTTIGSFPQTKEIRKARAFYRKGRIDRAEYEKVLEEEIAKVVQLQEELGLDVLVHGESERNDMVEYFGEQMDGFAFTRRAWVQSYGSRYVKPPVIYGDVRRPEAMTVRWIAYAQSLTDRPVKGMLTGPVTILNWSFVRDDQPRRDTCFQIALAIRDEVVDLEKAGIRIIQVDEPALREGLPLRKQEWPDYLEWAVSSFRLATAGVNDETQIQTHMCYSQFGDVIQAISDLDADVILIENSRSDLELLKVFERFRYDKEIGPGVYDIHSPRVPTVEEMVTNLEQSARVLDPELLWVNPDCGLKTRDFEETTPSLRNMVEAARRIRESISTGAGAGGEAG